MKASVALLCLLSATASAFAPVKLSSVRSPIATSSPSSPAFIAQNLLTKEKEDTAVATLEKPEVVTTTNPESTTTRTAMTTSTETAVTSTDEAKPEEELSETQKLMQQVKDSGTAGVISYALWELAFWIVSVPVVLAGYYGVTGHFPDLSDKEDLAKLGAEAFAFVNFARLAVPLRIGLALSTTPWIKDNVVDKFFHKGEEEQNNNNNESA